LGLPLLAELAIRKSICARDPRQDVRKRFEGALQPARVKLSIIAGRHGLTARSPAAGSFR
jgi:hypothetical protein